MTTERIHRSAACLREALPCWLLIFGLTWHSDSHAEVVTSVADSTRAAAMKTIDNSVREGDLTKAREVIEQAFPYIDKVEIEVKVAESMLGIGKVAEARTLLDPFLFDDAPRWDVHLVFAKMALFDRHWSDAWVHARMAEASKVPKPNDRQTVDKIRDEIALVKIQSAEARGNWTLVESLAEALIARSPSQKQGVMALAKAKFQNGDSDTAEKLLIRLKGESAQIPSPSLILAKLCEVKPDYAAAEKYYLQAIAESTEEDSPATQNELARFYLWTNRPDKVSSLLSVAFADSDMERERQFLLASAARMNGNYPVAEQLLTTLHQADGTNFSISNSLALVLVESPNETLRARALQIAQSNVRNFQSIVEAWATLGWIQFRLGDIRAAEESLSIATQGGSIGRDTAYFMSEVFARLGNSDQASKLKEATKSAQGPFFYKRNMDVGLKQSK